MLYNPEVREVGSGRLQASRSLRVPGFRAARRGLNGREDHCDPKPPPVLAAAVHVLCLRINPDPPAPKQLAKVHADAHSRTDKDFRDSFPP